MKGASAIVYDVLLIVILSLLTLAVLVSAPKTASTIFQILTKTHADRVANDLAGSIAGLYTSPFDTKVKYCFPKEENYFVEIENRNLNVTIYKGGEKCEKNVCKGHSQLPISLDKITFFSLDLPSACVLIEKIGSKVILS